MAAHYEGIAEFVVEGEQHPFQFKVSVTDDKLRIWIEDTVTKHQWQSKDLEVKDVVTLDTAIPMAKAKDYAVRVAECMARSRDAESPMCSLSPPTNDKSRVLRVGVNLHAMGYSTALEYTFTLQSVQLDPVDLLSVRLSNLEASATKEGANLTATIQTLEKTRSTEYAHLIQVNSTMKSTVAALTTRVDTLLSQLDTLANDRSTQDYEQLKMENSQLRSKIDALSSRLDVLANAGLADKYAQLSKENANLKRTIAKLSSQHDALTDARLAEKHAELKSVVSAHSTKLDGLAKAQLPEVSAQLKEGYIKLKKVVNEHSFQLDELAKAQMPEQLAQLTTKGAKLNQTINMLSAKLDAVVNASSAEHHGQVSSSEAARASKSISAIPQLRWASGTSSSTGPPVFSATAEAVRKGKRERRPYANLFNASDY